MANSTGQMPAPDDPLTRQALLLLKEAVKEDIAPYIDHMQEGFKRTERLVNLAVAYVKPREEGAGERRETSDDILRSVVVLTHAYLEDFLRTLARALLPIASEAAVNAIPLAGLGGNTGRAEKFFLGKLTQHRGKSVDDVIRESVEEYLGRVSFNSGTEIMSFLGQLGVKPNDPWQLKYLDQMIQRRHLIVHRADKINNKVQAIKAGRVLNWSKTTVAFMGDLLMPLLLKQYTPDYVQRRFNILLSKEEVVKSMLPQS
jgi:RiboL-PSP-HEPN